MDNYHDVLDDVRLALTSKVWRCRADDAELIDRLTQACIVASEAEDTRFFYELRNAINHSNIRHRLSGLMAKCVKTVIRHGLGPMECILIGFNRNRNQE